jgi:hypothetical protein
MTKVPNALIKEESAAGPLVKINLVVETLSAIRKIVVINNRVGKELNSAGDVTLNEVNKISMPESKLIAIKASNIDPGKGMMISAKINITPIPKRESLLLKYFLIIVMY